MKILTCLILITFVTASCFAAFAPEIQILSKEEISKLSDEKLIETYIDVVVEIEAMEAFHGTSGFTPKEYKIFKDWLKYRIALIGEMNKRELTVPQVE